MPFHVRSQAHGCPRKTTIKMRHCATAKPQKKKQQPPKTNRKIYEKSLHRRSIVGYSVLDYSGVLAGKVKRIVGMIL